MRNVIPLILLTAACAAPGGGGNPGSGDDTGGPDAGASAHAKWDGTSHITAADGAIYDSVFSFAYDDALGEYDVESGQVNITRQPTFSGDCTITIDSSHAIGQHDGMMVVSDGPGVAGGGSTVWLATYTAVCPNGTSTSMQPYAAYWWPQATPPDPTPIPAPGGTVTIPIDEQLGSGTVTLTEE